MTALTEFLLARVAEDEAVARADLDTEQSNRWYVPEGAWLPSRVLAECEAKRRIVAEVEAIPGQQLAAPGTSRLSLNHSLDRVIRLLALPYADHPDFREEWT